MKLYYAPGACSMAPHIVAAEAGQALDLEKVDLRAHKTADGADYYGINPKGYVPALKLDDGQLLTEVGNLVQYIADKNPASNLAPAAGTMERYRLMEWLAFISSEIHKGFGPLFYPDTPEQTKESAKDKLAKRFGWVDGQLAGKDYLMDAFTVADAYLFTVTNWTKNLGIDLSAFPNLQAFMMRVAERPKVRQAMEEEGLLKAA